MYDVRRQAQSLHSAAQGGNGHRGDFRLLTGLVLAVLLSGSPFPVAQAQSANPQLQKVLARLDEVAAKFHTAQADVTWDNVQTQPIFDKDTQAGTMDVERRKGSVAMALHLKTLNGRPVPKEMVYAGGEFKLYEPLLKQMTVFRTAGRSAQIESFLVLGFGGSATEMQKDWVVSYAGAETIHGVATEKLQLLPRTEAARQNVTRVLLWIDMKSGIAIQQQSFDPAGNYRMVDYTVRRVNGGLPADAFSIKLASGTRVIQR